MTPMVDFSLVMLQALADFMGAEPMIYLFGAIVFCWLCKGIRILLGH